MGKCGNCCYGVMTGANQMFCSAQNCLCEEVFYCEDYEPIVKPQTNADRIRSMSDEELADELLSLFAAFYAVEWSSDAVLDWLKEEVTANDS